MGKVIGVAISRGKTYWGDPHKTYIRLIQDTNGRVLIFRKLMLLSSEKSFE